eukprot:2394316-Pyramimonas_sp.AAC.1
MAAMGKHREIPKIGRPLIQLTRASQVFTYAGNSEALEGGGGKYTHTTPMSNWLLRARMAMPLPAM